MDGMTGPTLRKKRKIFQDFDFKCKLTILKKLKIVSEQFRWTYGVEYGRMRSSLSG
jgi:hypothetical protein